MGVRRWLGPVGADELMESRMDTSSIQYGAAATSSVRSTADPWMNFENLYTCERKHSPRDVRRLQKCMHAC